MNWNQPNKNNDLDLNNLDWTSIVKELQKLATCELSRDKIELTTPLSSADEALNHIHQILEAQSLLREQNRPKMESLDLFYTWFKRLQQQATLKTMELRDTRNFCIEALELKQVLEKYDLPWSQSVLKQLLPAEEPLSAIDQIITFDGEIRSDASEKLFQLYKEKQQLARHIEKTLDKMVKLHEMESLLQDKYVTNREGRWVLPIKSGLRHNFEGIIHAQSNSKQTVFMEPQEIVPLNNRIQSIESEIQEEIEFLLRELSHYLSSLCPQFEKSHAQLLEADIHFAKAQMNQKIKGKAVQFTSNRIHLKELKHPLLVLQQIPVVANTVSLTPDKRILLLSGPNAGGKTVLLKSVGLALYMASCGLPICASTESEVPFIKKIYSAIGDHQSVDEKLSTFAAHLKVLNSALNATGFDQLILVDEICGSTDPEEGSALARSFIQHYEEQNTFAVITSHLSPLKMGWSPKSGVINGSLEFDKTKGQPSYQFLMGVPGESLAIKTAQRVGIDPEIIENAIKQLNPQTQKYMDKLMEVEKIKEELLKQKLELKTEREQATKFKNQYQHLLEKMEKEKDALLAAEVEKSKKEIESLMNFDKVDDIFKRHEKYEKIKKELPKVIKQPTTEAIESAEDFKNHFPPGTKIYIPSLDKEGIVQSEPNAKGEVVLQAQSMRVSIHWEQLEPVAKRKTSPSPKSLSGGASGYLRDRDRVVDLRGQFSEEALHQLDHELDQALLAGEDRVKVIHGHGSESLKRAIRRHLSRSEYVRKWQAGDPNTGGDGITWVELG